MRLDAGPEQSGTSVTCDEDGLHTVYVSVQDHDGNVLGEASKSFKIDQTQPELGFQAAGEQGENGWLISDAEVSLTATDDTSKLLQVDQALDSSSLLAYQGKQVVTQEGLHTVHAEVLDNAQNKGTLDQTYKIDKSKPVISNVYLQDEYFWGQDFPIRFDVSDAVSQVAQVRATINRNPVEKGSVYRFTEPGWHTYHIEVKDHAGWKAIYEEKFEVYIPVDFNFDPDSLQLDHGKGMATSYLELPEPFDPAQIEFATVELNGHVAHVQDPKYGYVKNPIGDENDNGIPEMMLKYERAALVNVIEPEHEEVTSAEDAEKWSPSHLTIWGNWGEYHIKGYDAIRTVNSGYTPPPPDVTSPSVESDPLDGQTNVGVDVTPHLQFSEGILLPNQEALTDQEAHDLVRLQDGQGQLIPFTANWLKNSHLIQINPVYDWQGTTSYSVSFADNAVQDMAGNGNVGIRSAWETEAHVQVFATPLPEPVLKAEPEQSSSDSTSSPTPTQDSDPTPTQTSPSPTTPVQSEPAEEEILPEGVVQGEVLKQALADSATQDAILLTAPSDEQTLAFTPDQLEQAATVEKPLDLQFADVRYRVAPDALLPDDQDASDINQLSMGIEPVDEETVTQVLQQANNHDRYLFVGVPHHLVATIGRKDGTEQPLHRFGGQVEVELTVPEVAFEAARQGRLRMGRYNDQTHLWDEYPGVFDEERGTFTFETDRFSDWQFLLDRQARTFADLQHHWASEMIQEMATLGYVNGQDASHFAPERNISRAEGTTLLVRLFNVAPTSDALPFADVSDRDWYAPYVRRAFAADLVHGVGTVRFDPSSSMTREQLFTMLSHALQAKGVEPLLSDQEEVQEFADADQLSAWAKPAAEQLIALGVLAGRSDGKHLYLAPQETITRAEAAVLFYRAMKLM
ncbi:MAG TPA: S-layer homology domain-containing protein [Bacilli bacterium]|nr:S-layer homology domain-containing protein [Bacilli bacterium]